MPTGEQGMASGRLSREQVLDELGFLATVEHALVVEYLSVCCALGHDLEAEEGGATTRQGRAAAAAASVLAQGEMFHLKGVNRGLVDAGRSAQPGRAGSIASNSVAEITLGPPGPAQLERIIECGEGIASAADERYARLRTAVTSHPVFEGELLDELRAVIVDDGPTHAAAFAALRDSLRDLAPADFLRATRREASDAFERRLLHVSDRYYGLVLAALQERFGQQDFVTAGSFRSFAVSAMEGLDEINRALVQRGLLPPFTIA
ncbi:hypothetical protein [Pseudonocardia asaccharolytica]|uniref:Iminophenyl-pyruvate dimer synthase domain-containing protein n=1 Tax=Pseudonocardia asaccharolytica DSM 44247 = NBRC 16224 TaxID=1123024 RepID=A0A511D7Y7_9PSEU|nr:hypothetical protein [Pseudonocardia asaccharolytica]GEL20896.1 hypothetical protein PA7_47330 [Pseudonocardia asaccharolytica DSM 44247 = NBRC 16224]